MTQLDLFGECAGPAVAHERVLWAGRFERADWVAPSRTSGGQPAGTVFHGVRCPDPECGEVEPTGFVLLINHGFDPDVPGRAPWHGHCAKVWRRRAEEAPAP